MLARSFLAIAAACALSMSVMGCSPPGEQPTAQPMAAPIAGPAVRVEAMTITPTPGGRDMSAGYMTIRNTGAEPDTLLSVSSPAAGRIDIHETRMDAQGVMQMFPIAGGVTVPAQGEIAFAPGGLHLMLMDLAAPLTEGERVVMTLTFQRTGPVQIEAVVARPGGGAHAH